MTEDTIYLTRREDSVITVYSTDYSYRDIEEVYSYGFDSDEFEFFSATVSDLISGGGGERFYFE